MSVYTKLSAVQQELKAPKGQFNAFGKYKYRSCEDILESVKPILQKHNSVLYLSDHVELVGDRNYIVATATFGDLETAETVQVTAMAREESEKKGMDSSQITGAASSYARKYALNGLFCIDDTKDSDSTNTGPVEICSDCGGDIEPYDDGKRAITSKEIAKRSTEMFGRPLCARCSKRAGKQA